MIRLLLISVSTFLCTSLFANSNSVRYLTNADTVWIKITNTQTKYFNHQVKPKQTLYSLSRFYGLDMLDVFDSNPWLKKRVLDLHDVVKVPIQNRIIKTLVPQNKSNYAPVYYRVQKKDNLFRIARRYFDLPVNELMQRNGLNNYDLSINQPLLIGWINLNGAENVQNPALKNQPSINEAELMGPFQIHIDESQILASFPNRQNTSKSEVKEVIEKVEDESIEDDAENMDVDRVSEADIAPTESTPIKSEIKSLQKTFEEEKINYVYTEERGVAHWSKDIKHKTDLYVLHKSAPVGSTVQIFNPLISKSIYAKVIAPIPSNMYPEKVKVIVSPAVANLLGAVDSQFFVKVKYLAPEN